MIAASLGGPEVVEVLLDNGARLGTQDDDKSPALSYVVDMRVSMNRWR